MKLSICKGCGASIIWARNPETGKNVPLDSKAPVYEVTFTEGDTVVVARDRNAYVSHFATCKEANRFSGSKKQQGDLFDAS